MAYTPNQTLCSLLCAKSGQFFAAEDFEESYVHICKLTAAAAKSLDDDLLARARVRTVRLMKERDGPEHEYLLIYITIDGLPKEVAPGPLGVIKCERTVASHLRTRRRFRKFAVSSLSCSSSPFRSLKHSPALDHLTVYGPGDLPQTSKRDQLVYEYDFPASRTPAPTRLFAAASILHDSFPDYILLQRQCYWYAGMVFRMLVGTDADKLCATKHSEHVQLAIAYQSHSELEETSLCGGAETTTARPDAQHDAVKVSAGTFGAIFKLVTAEDIEKCYTSVESAFQARLAQVDSELDQVRENAKQRLKQFAAMSQENAELKAQLAGQNQHQTVTLWMPLSDSRSSSRSSTTPIPRSYMSAIPRHRNTK